MIAAADSTYVAERQPDSTFAGAATIQATSQHSAEAIAYIKFVVPKHNGTHVTGAEMTLTTATSAIGTLELHTVASNQWQARQVSYLKRPALYGALARAPGPTSVGSVINFNLSDLITAPGVYSFAITSASKHGIFAAYGASNRRSGPRLRVGYAHGPTTTHAEQAYVAGGPGGARQPGTSPGASPLPSPGNVSQGVSALPSGVLPSGLLPSGLLPSGLLPTGLPSGVVTAPGGVVVPTATTEPTKAPAPPPNPPGKPIPAGATICGATFQVNSGQAYTSAFSAEESRVGNLASARVFNTGAPQGWPGNAGSLNRTVIVSFKYLPTDILAGREDSYLKSWFASAPRDRNVYWSYYHEPEDQIESNTFTASDYRAAWRHIAALADQANNPRLYATLILMGWTALSQSGKNWRDYYPGDDVIDVMGWDVYNLGNTKGTYTSPSSLLDPVIADSKSVGKPWGIAEMGAKLASSDNGNNRAAWITQMVTIMRDNKALWAEYFDLDKSNAGRYDWRLQDSPSQNAWASFCRS